MKTDRRNLLRIFGLGGAAAVGETMPGIGNVWMFGSPPPLADEGVGAWVGANRGQGMPGLKAIAYRHHAQYILEEARQIERAREYAMTDWGGAL